MVRMRPGGPDRRDHGRIRREEKGRPRILLVLLPGVHRRLLQARERLPFAPRRPGVVEPGDQITIAEDLTVESPQHALAPRRGVDDRGEESSLLAQVHGTPGRGPAKEI